MLRSLQIKGKVLKKKAWFFLFPKARKSYALWQQARLVLWALNTLTISNHKDSQAEVEEWVDTIRAVKHPTLYQVVLLNDDYTPMDFVVHILMKFFFKSLLAANELMLKIHKDGFGVCGIYPREIAETKARQVLNETKKHGFPLRCIFEPVS